MSRRVDIGRTFARRAKNHLTLPADVDSLPLPVCEVDAVNVLADGAGGEEVTVTNEDTGESATVDAETAGRTEVDLAFEDGQTVAVTIDSASEVILEYTLKRVPASS